MRLGEAGTVRPSGEVLEVEVSPRPRPLDAGLRVAGRRGRTRSQRFDLPCPAWYGPRPEGGRPAGMTEIADSDASTIRLRADEVLFLNRQLASMARLNMPIAKGLRVLGKEVREGDFRQVIERLQQDLDEGRSLSDAMARFPATFSSLQLEIVRAGETSGNLSVILDELNAHTECMQRVKSRVLEAVSYPAVMMTVIFGFVLMFLVFVAPQFESMMREREAAATALVTVEQAAEAPRSQLPVYTRALFAASGLIRNPLVFLLVFGGGLGAGVWGFRKISRMGEEYDDFLFGLPRFGRLFEKAALMKVTRTMRDLLLNGVSMVEALRLTSRTVGQNRIARKLDELRQAVEEGGSFSRSLGEGEVFPESMVWKLQLAEEKGLVEDALLELAGGFEQEVDQETTFITKALAPLLLVFTGGVVLFMFTACFVPLTQLYGQS